MGPLSNSISLIGEINVGARALLDISLISQSRQSAKLFFQSSYPTPSHAGEGVAPRPLWFGRGGGRGSRGHTVTHTDGTLGIYVLCD